MKQLSFLISLTNNDNDYQQEQAAAAEKAARRLGVEVKIVHASNDPLVQSQQLLQYVQDSSRAKPDAIMFEPAGGTAFPQVARAAAAAGDPADLESEVRARLARGERPKEIAAALGGARSRREIYQLAVKLKE